MHAPREGAHAGPAAGRAPCRVPPRRKPWWAELPAAAGAFALGAWLVLRLPDPGPLPPAWTLGLLPALALAAWRLPGARILAFLAAGALAAGVQARLHLEQELPAWAEGRDLVAEGVVVGLPHRHPRGWRFDLAVEGLRRAADGRPVPFAGRARLSWYGGAPRLEPGQRWELRVRLRRPHGLRNPGGFDYEGWLFRRGIRAVGYVRAGGKAPPPRFLGREGGHLLDRARQAVLEAVHGAVGGRPHGGLVAALAVGDRSGIGPREWETLARTGTSHLVAISGLHVGLVAGAAFLLGRRAAALWPALCLRWPAPRAGAVAALAAAALYAALAGFSVPTRRALVMVGAAVAGPLLGRRSPSSRVLALALLAVLALDPLAVLDPGLWLSFGAVAAILLGAAGGGTAGGAAGLRERRLLGKAWGRAWREAWRVSWVSALGLIPLLLAFFQGVPLASPLANLAAVPVVGLGAVPPALAGALLAPWSPVLGEPLLRLAEAVLGALWPFLEALAAPDWGQWTPPAAETWASLLAVAGVLLLLAPPGLPGRWLGVVLLAPALLAPAPAPPPGTAWVTVLDVGQGLAAVVRTARHVLVYDAGPRLGPRLDAGSAALLPYLRYQGIREVDLLVLSHGDADHVGGAAALARGVFVGAVLASEARRLPAGVPAAPCLAGQAWTWDGVRFELLGPAPGERPAPWDARGRRRRGWNDASCVLRVAAGAEAALLPGDLEGRGERRLLRRVGPERLRAALLLAPHHGSRSSSTAAFVAAVRPRYVVFPVGYRNRYRLPASEVAARYRAAGAETLEVQATGAVRFVLDGRPGMAPPERFRWAARRLWHRLDPQAAGLRAPGHGPAVAGTMGAAPAME